MFSNNIKTIIDDLKNKKVNIMENKELIDMYLNGTENNKKLACLIILATDNKKLNIYRDPNFVKNMFNKILDELLLQSIIHNELGNILINIYTNLKYK
jgi:hypothetical protein